MIECSDREKIQRVSDAMVAETLHRPVTQFMECRGKRIRGSLMQVAFAMAGGRGVLPPVIAESVECLHAGSLVIDDIQDASNRRRDSPTLHQQIGTPLAINAGNWMYFRAIDLLSSSSLPAAKRCQMTTAMISAAMVCHEGQAIDLGARVDRLSPDDWRDVAESISLRKTGVLVGLAMELGALAANAEATLTSALRTLGCQIGVALQMRNDLAELTDLDRDDDLRNARVTWPWAWLAEQSSDATCRRLASGLEDSPQDRLQALASEIAVLVGPHGDRQIRRCIDQAIGVVGEQVVDGGLLGQLRGALEPIRRPTFSQPATEATL